MKQNIKFWVSFTFGLLLSTGLLSAESRQIDSLNNLLTTSLKDTSKINVLNQLAFTYRHISPQKSKENALEALSLSKSIRYKKGEAKAEGILGLYHAITGDYFASVDHYNLALNIYQQLNDGRGISKTFSNLGVVYQYQSKYNKALEYYFKALELEEKNNNQQQVAVIHGNLGNLYDDHREFDAAILHYREAIKYFKKKGALYNVSAVYGNLGLVFYHQSNYDSALFYYDKAIQIDKTNNHLNGLSNHIGNKALVYKETGRFKQALENYNKAYQLDSLMNIKSGLAFDLEGMSSCYLKMGNDAISSPSKYQKSPNNFFEKGIELGLQSEKIHHEIQSRNFNVYNTIKELYIASGNLEKALEYSDKYWVEKNKVFSAEKAREFSRLEAQKERELSEKRIEILKSEQTTDKIILCGVVIILLLVALVGFRFYSKAKKRKETNQKLADLNNQLEDALSAKDKFFSIIAHDLINPVSGLVSAVNVFKREHQQMSSQEMDEYLNVLAKSSVKAKNLLTNLLEWSRLQKNQIAYTPRVDNLKTTVLSCFELHKNLAEAKDIKTTTNLEEIETSYDEHMINSVISNLLNNAIKFTPNQGNISLSLKEDGRWAKLEITDTGVGMTDKQIKNAFRLDQHSSTPGTNQEPGTGLGLILCKEFIDIHNGQLDIVSELGKGTRFTVRIPLK